MRDFTGRPSMAARFGGTLDRIESVYLKVLRAVVLLVATLLLLWALGWAALSVVRILRSPDSVVEASSTVTSSDLLAGGAERSMLPTTSSEPRNTAEQRNFYGGFVQRYHRLYKARFEPNLRQDDKRLNQGEFDDLTIDSSGRLRAIRNGELDFATDRADLETYLPVVTEAAEAPETASRLAKYRTAKKQRVVSQVQRTRTETRRGWDSSSMDCSNWYVDPIGCATTRQIETPYTERVTSTRYPDGISSPNQVLKSYQDRYFSLLADRRRESAAKADAERDGISFGQVQGWTGLSQSVLVAGGFLALMFFFLLIAIERHQRGLSVRTSSNDDELNLRGDRI